MSASSAPSTSARSKNLLEPALLARLAELSLRYRRRLASAARGERRSQRRGSSLEFVDYRQYAAGDDLRQIDWNVFGRLDTLVLKLFEDEELLSVHLLLDTSKSMDWGHESKLRYATQVAGALGYVALAGYDTVEAFLLGSGSHFGPARGRAGVSGLFNFLQGATGDGPTDLNAAVKTFAAHQHAPGLVLLFTDLFDPAGIGDALGRLRQQRHQVIVFHTLSGDELVPTLNGDLLLVDSESGEQVEMTLDRHALDAYDARLRAWLSASVDTCRRHNASYVLLNTARPLASLLFSDLRHQGLLL